MTSRLLVLDERGNAHEEADFATWASWFYRIGNRQLGCDILPDGRLVTTIFLGMDDGSGMLFESVLWQGTEPLEGSLYPTREAAQAGHAALLAKALKELQP